MRTLAAVVVAVTALAACSDDEAIPIDAPIAIDAPPPIDAPMPIDAVDAMEPVDAGACAACGANEICVQFFNGTCGDGHVECQTRGVDCTGNACSTECNFWHCGGADAGIYTCSAAGCAGEVAGALHCYGP